MAEGDGEQAQLEVVYSSILDQVLARLAARSSALVVDGGLDPEFPRNVIGILDEAVGSLRAGASADSPGIAVDYSGATEFAQTGQLRAAQNMHPAESLMAAEVLFDVALPLLAGASKIVPDTADGALAAAKALHHAIWRRFPPGAIAYAETLRQRYSAVHSESRQRLSRDLHDRVAHVILAGAHRVELASMADGLPHDVTQSLGEASVILHDALIEVRELAVELRSRVGDLTIDEAIRRYVENSSSAQTAVEVTGRSRTVTSWVAEELFAIVIEALRNARVHDSAGVRVAVEWGDDRIVITVSDAGPGFDPHHVRPSAIGLADMAERAAIIGARLTIDSAPGRNTMITVAVPLGHGTRPANGR